jgi:hypothetical protein
VFADQLEHTVSRDTAKDPFTLTFEPKTGLADGKICARAVRTPSREEEVLAIFIPSDSRAKPLP